MDLPRGNVTFLFSDIEGSTRLLERFGSRLTDAMSRHHDLLTAVVERHGGCVFETVGDAVYGAFADPMGAMAAAVDCHRVMAATDWADLGDVRVRIALHRGPVELRGEHYIGPALFRTARIQALGHGGQTLVSEELADAVRGRLPDDVTLRSLGRHRLKDLVDAEVVHQLDAHDLPGSFPPLRSFEARIDTLPGGLSRFIGREQELAEVRDALTSARLVTLTGSGGTGKTRLAIEAARAVADRFADGILFVDLAPVRDAALVAGAIVSVVGVRPIADESPERALSRWLADRQLLIVLDNLEQVVAAGPLLVRLLEASRASRLLGTSRVRLRVRGEMPIAVPPMELSHGSGPSTAARLFSDRAGLDTVGHAPEDLAAIEAICRRLDGLPLAIELAAARASVLPPARLLRLLDRRLTLLTSGDRDLPDRQRTLAATIAWSLDLLPAGDRRLFERLGVFIGGWSLDAAVAVAGDDDELATVDALGALADASLIRVLPPDALGEPRYTMLETTREAALGYLTDEDRTTALARHGAWMAGLAERAEPELVRSRAPDWLTVLDLEMANLRLAMATALETGEALTAHRIASALWRLGFLRGASLAEVTAWCRDSLAMPGVVPPRIRARTQVAFGSVGMHILALEELEAPLHEAVAVLGPLGPSNELADAYCTIGAHRANRGIVDGTAAWIQLAADTWGAIGHERGRGMALMGLAVFEAVWFDAAGAADMVAPALAASRRGDSPLSLMEDLANAVGILAWAGRTDEAVDAAHEVAGLRRRTGYADPFFDLNFGDGLARVLLTLGMADDAARLHGSTVETIERFAATTDEAEAQRRSFHARLTAALGTDTELLIAEGRALDVTTAVDHGLELLEAIGRETGEATED